MQKAESILLLSLSLSLFCLNGVYSQSIGAKFGFNIAKIVGGEDLEDIDEEDFDADVAFRTGIQIGLAAEFPINDRVSFQPELLYLQKGYTLEGAFFGEQIEVDAILNYFEVPLLAKININQGPTQFFFHLGPSFSYGIDGKVRTSFGGFQEEIEADFGEDEEVNRIDFNGVLGAGIQVESGNGKLVFDARYVHDFNDFAADRADVGGEATYSRNIGLSVGYFYTFKNKSAEVVEE